MELASYGKFGFSTPDLHGYKLAKGMYLVRKKRYTEVFLVVPRSHQFFCFELKT